MSGTRIVAADEFARMAREVAVLTAELRVRGRLSERRPIPQCEMCPPPTEGPYGSNYGKSPGIDHVTAMDGHEALVWRPCGHSIQAEIEARPLPSIVTDSPEYAVIRVHPDMPLPWPPNLDGWWYDMDRVPQGYGPADGGAWVAVPTDRFETREDGAVAQVWEIRP